MKALEKKALLQVIKTANNLIGYAIKDDDLEMIELHNKSLQRNIDILNALKNGDELTYFQNLDLKGVIAFYNERQEKYASDDKKDVSICLGSNAVTDKKALTYQGSNEAIEKDGSELKAVKLQNLKHGEFFIISNKSKSVMMKSSYDRSSKKYECSNFDDISDYKYYNGNKTVYIGFTF